MSEDTPSRSLWRRPAILIAAALAVLAVLGGGWLVLTAGPSAEEREAAELARAEADEASTEADEAAEGYAECEEAMAEQLDEVTAIDSQLAVGMSYKEYEQDLDAATAAAGTVSKAEISDDCFNRVKDPLDAALIYFGEALEVWEDCVFDTTLPDCDSISGELNRWWNDANAEVRAANNGMVALEESVGTAEAEAEQAEADAQEAEAVVE